MTTTTTTLADFLLARIGAFETLAREAMDSEPDWALVANAAAGQADVAAGWHVLRNDPARVLAECAAKRAIVEEFKVFSKVRAEAPEGLPLPQALTSAGIVTGLERAVRHLAAAYADHADYDPSWAVS